MAGNRQQSRFLALVSSYDRLKTESAIAAEAENAAQLQILKTMDSVEYKTQQLKTSIQELYIGEGLQNTYKWILDIGNAWISSLNNLSPVISKPISLLISLGSTFYNVGNLAVSIFALLKVKLVKQMEEIQEYIKRKAEERKAIARGEVTNELELYGYRLKNLKNFEDKKYEIEKEGARKRRNIQNEEAAASTSSLGIGAKIYNGLNSSTGRSIASLGGSFASLGLSALASNPNLSSQWQGGLNLASSALSGVSMGSILGPWGMLAGAIGGGLIGLIQNWDSIFESEERKIKKLQEDATEKTNTFLKTQDSTKQLAQQVQKLRELDKARHDSNEKEEEYYTLTNQLAQTYPDLIKSMDESGQMVLDLKAAEDKLTESRKDSAKAAAEVTLANYKANLAAQQEAEENRNNAIPEDADTYLNKILYAFIGRQYAHDNVTEAQWADFFNHTVFQEGGFGVDDIDDWLKSYGYSVGQFTGSSGVSDMDAADFLSYIIDPSRMLSQENMTAYNEMAQSNIVDSLFKLAEMVGPGSPLKKLIDEIISTNGVGEYSFDVSELINPLDIAVYNYIAGSLKQGLQVVQEDVIKKSFKTDTQLRSGLSQQVAIAASGFTDLPILESTESILSFITSQIKTEVDNLTTQKEKQDYISNTVNNRAEKLLDDYNTWWEKVLNEQDRQIYTSLEKNKKFISKNVAETIINNNSRLSGKNDEGIDFINIDELYEDTYDAFDFAAAWKDRLADTERQFKSNGFIVKYATTLLKMGEAGLQNILSVYDDLEKQVSNKTMTVENAQSFLDAYMQIQQTIFNSDDYDLDQIAQLSQMVTSWDDYSLSGLSNLLTTLLDLDFVTEDSEIYTKLLELRQYMTVNLNTEIQTYLDSITKGIKDFTSALSDASKGMSFDKAVEMAKQLSTEDRTVTLDDFRYDKATGKYYYDTIADIQAGYIKADENLQEWLGFENEDIQKVLSVTNEASLKDLKDDEGRLLPLAQHIQDAYQTYVEQQTAAGQEAETFEKWYESIKELLAQVPTFNQYIIDQTALAQLQAGKITDFLNTLGIEDTTEVQDLINKEDWAALANYKEGILKDWVSAIYNTLNDATEKTLSTIEGNIGKGQITVDNIVQDSQEQKVYEALADRGLFKWIDEGHTAGVYEVNAQNVNRYYDSLNDLNLSVSEYNDHVTKANEILHSSKNNVNDFITKDTIIDKDIQEYADAIGMSVESIKKAFGLTWNEVTGSYDKNVEQAQKFYKYQLNSLYRELDQVLAEGDQIAIARIRSQILDTENALHTLELTDRQKNDKALKDVIDNRENKITDNMVQAFAERFNILDTSKIFKDNNKDGYFTLDIVELRKTLANTTQEYSQEYLESLEASVIDAAISMFTGVSEIQTKGSTNYSQLTSTVQQLRDILENKDIDFNKVYTFDTDLNAWTYSMQGLQWMRDALQQQLADVGIEGEEAEKIINAQLTSSYFGSFSAQDFVNIAKNPATNNATVKNYQRAIDNYNQQIADGDQKFDFNSFITQLKEGGAAAVQAWQDYCRTILNREATVEEITQVYNTDLMEWEAAGKELESITEGSIIKDAKVAALLDSSVAELEQLADGTWVVKALKDMPRAIRKYNYAMATWSESVSKSNQYMSEYYKSLVDNENNALSDLKNVSSISIDTLKVRFDAINKKMIDVIGDNYQDVEKIGLEYIGGGQFKITNITTYMEEFYAGIDKTSDAYIAAYNEAILQMKTQDQKSSKARKDLLSTLAGVTESTYINLTDALTGTDEDKKINTALIDKLGIKINEESNEFVAELTKEQADKLFNLYREIALSGQDSAEFGITAKQATDAYSKYVQALTSSMTNLNVGTILDGEAAKLLATTSYFKNKIDASGRIVIESETDLQEALLAIYGISQEAYESHLISLETYNDVFKQQLNQKYKNQRAVLDVLKSNTNLTIDNLTSMFGTLMPDTELFEEFFDENFNLINGWDKYFSGDALSGYKVTDFEGLIRRIETQFSITIDRSADAVVEAAFSALTEAEKTAPGAKERLIASYQDHMSRLSIEELKQIALLWDMTEQEIEALIIRNKDDGTYDATLLARTLDYDRSHEAIIKATEEDIKSFTDTYTNAITTYFNSNKTDADKKTLDKAVQEYIRNAREAGWEIENFSEDLMRVLDTGGLGAIETIQSTLLEGQQLTPEQIKTLYRGKAEKYNNALNNIVSTPGTVVDQLTSDLIRVGGGATQKIGEDTYVVLQSTQNMLNSYRSLLQQMKNSAASISERNAVVKKMWNEQYGKPAEQAAIDALSNAASMTYDQLGTIFESAGAALEDIDLDQLIDAGLLKRLGGNKVMIADFQGFAAMMGWVADSAEYLSAYSSYQDSILKYNQQMKNSITSELNSLKDFKVGDSFNVTYFANSLGKNINDFNDKISKFGLEITDGILKVTDNLGNPQEVYQGLIYAFRSLENPEMYAPIITSLHESLTSMISTLSSDIQTYSQNMTIKGDSAKLLAEKNDIWANQLANLGYITLNSIEEYRQAVEEVYNITRQAFDDQLTGLNNVNAAYKKQIESNQDLVQSSAKMTLLQSANSFDLTALETFFNSMNLLMENYIDTEGQIKGNFGVSSLGNGKYKITDWDKFRKAFLGKLDETSDEYIDAYIQYLQSHEDSQINSKEAVLATIIPKLNQLSYTEIQTIAKTFDKSVDEIMRYLRQNEDGTFNGHALLNNLDYDKNSVLIQQTINNQVKTYYGNLLSAVQTFAQSSDRSWGSLASNNLRKSFVEFKENMEGLGKSVSMNWRELRAALNEGGERAVAAMKQFYEAADQEFSEEDVKKYYRSTSSKLIDAMNKLTSTPGEIVDSLTAEIMNSVTPNAAKQIEGTSQYVVQTAVDLVAAYQELLKRLQASGTATLSELNSVTAKILTENHRTEQDVMDTLSSASGMTYDAFGELLARYDIQFTESLMKGLNAAGITKSLGGDKFAIMDFDALANFMNWDTDSDIYLSAFDTYRDAMIELNQQADKRIKSRQDTIDSEIQSLTSLKGGDQVNLAHFLDSLKDNTNVLNKYAETFGYNKVGKVYFQADGNTLLRATSEDVFNALITSLSSRLSQYGAKLENGLLTLEKDANITNIINTIIHYGDEYGIIAEDQLAALRDALDSLFSSLTSALQKGVKGTLTNAEAVDLSKQAKQLLDIDLDFKQTSEGLKISNYNAMQLYIKLKEVDEIHSSILRKDLSDSYQKAGGACENIRKTMGSIKDLNEQIVNSSGEQKKILQEQLGIYQDIAHQQLNNADSYKFMDEKLPDYLQGPVNYWESLGSMFEAINGSAQNGYMGVQDFYNVVNELNNMAKLSGQSISLLGHELSGNINDAADLIMEASNHFSIIDEKGAKGLQIDMKDWGKNFSLGAKDMEDGVKAGIKAMANSQIEMLDAMIAMLEVVVAMENLEEVDVNKNNTLDLGELFEDFDLGGDAKKYTQQAQEAAKEIMGAAEENDDLKAGLEKFKIGEYSLMQILDDMQDGIKNLNLDSNVVQAVMNALYQAFLSGDYDLDNLADSIWKVLDENLVEGLEFKIGDETIYFGANGHYNIKWETKEMEEIAARLGKENAELLRETYTESLQKENKTASDWITILAVEGIIKIKDNGKYEDEDGNEYDTKQEAVVAGLAKRAGFDLTEQEWKKQVDSDSNKTIGYEKDVIINDKSAYTISIGEKGIYYTDADGTTTSTSLNGLISAIIKKEGKTGIDAEKETLALKLKYGIVAESSSLEGNAIDIQEALRDEEGLKNTFATSDYVWKKDHYEVDLGNGVIFKTNTVVDNVDDFIDQVKTAGKSLESSETIANFQTALEEVFTGESAVEIGKTFAQGFIEGVKESWQNSNPLSWLWGWFTGGNGSGTKTPTLSDTTSIDTRDEHNYSYQKSIGEHVQDGLNKFKEGANTVKEGADKVIEAGGQVLSDAAEYTQNSWEDLKNGIDTLLWGSKETPEEFDPITYAIIDNPTPYYPKDGIKQTNGSSSADSSELQQLTLQAQFADDPTSQAISQLLLVQDEVIQRTIQVSITPANTSEPNTTIPDLLGLIAGEDGYSIALDNVNLTVSNWSFGQTATTTDDAAPSSYKAEIEAVLASALQNTTYNVGDLKAVIKSLKLGVPVSSGEEGAATWLSFSDIISAAQKFNIPVGKLTGALTLLSINGWAQGINANSEGDTQGIVATKAFYNTLAAFTGLSVDQLKCLVTSVWLDSSNVVSEGSSIFNPTSIAVAARMIQSAVANEEVSDATIWAIVTEAMLKTAEQSDNGAGGLEVTPEEAFYNNILAAAKEKELTLPTWLEVIYKNVYLKTNKAGEINILGTIGIALAIQNADPDISVSQLEAVISNILLNGTDKDGNLNLDSSSIAQLAEDIKEQTNTKLSIPQITAIISSMLVQKKSAASNGAGGTSVTWDSGVTAGLDSTDISQIIAWVGSILMDPQEGVTPDTKNLGVENGTYTLDNLNAVLNFANIKLNFGPDTQNKFLLQEFLKWKPEDTTEAEQAAIQYANELIKMLESGLILSENDIDLLSDLMQIDEIRDALHSTYKTEDNESIDLFQKIQALQSENINKNNYLSQLLSFSTDINITNLDACVTAMSSLVESVTALSTTPWDLIVNGINTLTAPQTRLNPTPDSSGSFATDTFDNTQVITRNIGIIVSADYALNPEIKGILEATEPIVKQLQLDLDVLLNTTNNSGDKPKTQDDSAITLSEDLAESLATLGTALVSAMSNVENYNAEVDETPDKDSIIKRFNDALNGVPSTPTTRVLLLVTALGTLSNKLTSCADTIYAAMNKIPTNKILNIKAVVEVEAQGGTLTRQYPSSFQQIDLTGAGAKGNVALAKGRTTLMGELGPELWVSNGHYYVAGQDGAEFVELPDDAIVFNHLQTKKLLSTGHAGRGTAVTNDQNAVAFAAGTSGPAMASAAATLAALKQIRAMWQSMLQASLSDLGQQAGQSGGGGKGGGGNGGGGGGGSGKDNEINLGYIADLERWYNLLRQIDKLEKEITYEEKLRSKIQSDLNKNGAAYYNSQKRSLDNLEQEIVKNRELSELQKSYYEARRKDLAESKFGNIFTFDENGLMQYNDTATMKNGDKGGLFALAKINAQNANGSPVYTAREQYNLLKAWGFEEEMKYDSSGKALKRYDSSGKENENYYTDAVKAFWDKADGWKEEMDSLYDSYNEKLSDILDEETKRNQILQEMINNQLAVEKEIYDAIENREQKIIDELQKDRDALEESSQKFIDGLNKNLQAERDKYQKNQETDELTKMQRQLAILQRSGGSASQILSLQKQINEAQKEQYFEAQQEQIDAIQKASDLELERLDTQIELLTQTLEFQKEHGLLWNEVYQIMNGTKEEITDFILANGKDWESKSGLQIDEDLDDLTSKLDQWIKRRDDHDAKMERDQSWSSYESFASTYFKDVWDEQRRAKAKEIFDEEYAKNADSNAAAELANKYLRQELDAYRKANPKVDPYNQTQPLSGSGGNSNSSGGGSSSSSSSTTKTNTSNNNTNNNKNNNSNSSSTTTTKKTTDPGTGNIKMIYRAKITSTGYSTLATETKTFTAGKSYNMTSYKKTFNKCTFVNIDTSPAKVEKGKTTIVYFNYKLQQTPVSGQGNQSGLNNPSKVFLTDKGYATGGMNYETGPAMLHGTKTRPEAIMNAEQTKIWKNDIMSNKRTSLTSLLANFRNGLAEFVEKGSLNNTTNENGINIEKIEMTMNVASIANDYDAKRAGEKALEKMVQIARKTSAQNVRR